MPVGSLPSRRELHPGTDARPVRLAVEVAMDELDHDRSLADGGGNSLYRAMADVARGEHARHARLQEQGGGGIGGDFVARDIGPREDEPRTVAGHAVAEPLGAWLGSHEDEKRIRAHLLSVT